MYSVVYVSSATQQFDDAQLLDLLNVCRRNNEALGVTGMLLYRGGNFMQALEGDRVAVQRLYAKISLDPRHGGVLKLLEQEIDTRSFANWSMGFRRVDEMPAELNKNFSELLNDDFVAPRFRQQPQQAWRLLLGFRDSMR